MAMITFNPTYPGSDIEIARLGEIEVGRTNIRGGKASWWMTLPGKTGHAARTWTAVRTLDDARAEIASRTRAWLQATGIASVLARAIDAMDRPAEDALFEDEWDAIIKQGKAWLE